MAEIMLWEHQKNALTFIDRQIDKGKNGVGLFMGLSTGKTITMLSWLERRRDKVKRVLIVTPKAAQYVWLRDAQHFNLSIVQLEGAVKDKSDQFIQLKRNNAYYILVNYDAIIRDPLAKALLQTAWDAVICDEAQRIKAYNSKTSKTIYKIGQNSKYRFALTGTPTHNKPLDIFGIARFLDDGVFGKNWYNFKYTYGIWTGPNNVILRGYKNLDTLAEKIKSFSYIVETEDVIDLPKERHITIPICMDKDSEKIYYKLEKDFIVAYNDSHIITDNILTLFLRLQQMTGGAVRTEDGQVYNFSSGKKEAFQILVEEIGNTPFVVFYKFNSDLNNIKEVLKQQDIAYCQLNGQVNELDLFNNGKAQAILVQTSSGSAGIDLTRAPIGIYYSISWSKGDYSQTLGRIRRVNQQNDSVTYYHLITKNTIDEDIYEAIHSNLDLTRDIINKAKIRHDGL